MPGGEGREVESRDLAQVQAVKTWQADVLAVRGGESRLCVNGEAGAFAI